MALDKDDIKQLIAILQKGLDDDPVEEAPRKRTPKTKNKKTNSTPNKFLEMGLINAHKEDIAIDKLLCKNPPTPRRQRIRTVDVSCRVCGKKESINPALLIDSPERYKCNKCCTSAG